MTKLAVAAIFAASLFLRVFVPWQAVFGGAYVNFQGNDSWYHMRLIDYVAANFPHRLVEDPYLGTGAPRAVPAAPMLDLLLGGVAWAIGLGAPSQRTVDLVGAWAPAVLGALATVPLYLFCARAFDRKIGLLAAGLLAVMPGPYFQRTALGNADHHVIEILFTLATFLLITISLQAAREPPAPATRRRALLFSCGAGLALAAYLFSWTSGAFLVAILTAGVVVQVAIDHLRGRSDDSVVRAALPAAVVALVLVAGVQDGRMPRHELQVASLICLVLACLLLEAARRVWQRSGRNPRRFPLALAGLAGAGAAVALLGLPRIGVDVLTDLARFKPGLSARTIAEVRPLFLQTGELSLEPAWLDFGSTFALALVGLVMLARRVRREGRPEHGMFLVAAIVFLLATLGQNRFAYYFALTAVVPAALVCGAVIDWSLRTATTRRRSAPRRGRIVVAALAIAGIAFAPGAYLVLERTHKDVGVTAPWHATLSWIRENTPDPFGDPATYRARLREGRWPTLAYSILAWWDFGYEIMRVARRVPYSNPTQFGVGAISRFYVETSEAGALDRLAWANARYVIVDSYLPFQPLAGNRWGGRFDSVVSWTKRPLDRYLSTYAIRNASGQLEPLYVLHPDYFRSMAVRLWAWGGRAATPANSSWVIQFKDARPGGPDQPAVRPGDGARAAGPTSVGPPREVIAVRQFVTYEQAVNHLMSLPRGTAEIVGFDPLKPCVPIEPLTWIREVYQSPGYPHQRVFRVDPPATAAAAAVAPSPQP